MLKKVLMCITCLACLFGCSSTKEETKESSKDQTVAKEEVKEESYDKKDTSNSSSDKKQSSNKDSEVKSTITQSNKNSTTSESITNSNTSTSGSKPNQNNTSSKPSSKPTEEPATPVTPPTPTPETVQPSYACPGGVNQNVSCDVILDSNFYYATYGSMSEAESAGEYYMNDVMYIGNAEITNYSVQPVYRNDHSIAYYGLNLWSNGSLIQ